MNLRIILNQKNITLKGKIKNYTFKDGLPHEFEILNLEALYTSNKKKLTGVHKTDFYQIIWFENATHIHYVDFQPIKIVPNTLLFLRPNMVHKFAAKEKHNGNIILFTDDFFGKSDQDITFLKSTILFNDMLSITSFEIQPDDSFYNTYLNLLNQEVKNNKDHFQTDILRNLLHNFLLYSERDRRSKNFVEIEKSADLDIVIVFRDLIEKNFRTLKKVSEYSTVLLLTTKRLNKATSNILGLSPKTMIINRVLLEAKRLLAHSNQSVKEIGFLLGFDEPTNFIKFFRQHILVTPLEFREKHIMD